MKKTKTMDNSVLLFASPRPVLVARRHKKQQPRSGPLPRPTRLTILYPPPSSKLFCIPEAFPSLPAFRNPPTTGVSVRPSIWRPRTPQLNCSQTQGMPTCRGAAQLFLPLFCWFEKEEKRGKNKLGIFFFYIFSVSSRTRRNEVNKYVENSR